MHRGVWSLLGSAQPFSCVSMQVGAPWDPPGSHWLGRNPESASVPQFIHLSNGEGLVKSGPSAAVRELGSQPTTDTWSLSAASSKHPPPTLFLLAGMSMYWSSAQLVPQGH